MGVNLSLLDYIGGKEWLGLCEEGEKGLKVTVYSTGCPKCTILEKKLQEKNIDYEVISDIDLMQKKGFMSIPMLEVDNEIMEFGAAVKWVNGA